MRKYVKKKERQNLGTEHELSIPCLCVPHAKLILQYRTCLAMSGSMRPLGSSTRKRSRSPAVYASRSSGSTRAIGAFTSTSRRSRSQLCCYLPLAMRESISGAPTESLPHLAEEPIDVLGSPIPLDQEVEETVETQPEIPSSSVRVPTSPSESSDLAEEPVEVIGSLIPLDTEDEETVETQPEIPSSSVRVPTSPSESPPFMFLTTLAAVISVYGRSYRGDGADQGFDYRIDAEEIDNPYRDRSLQAHCGCHDELLRRAYNHPRCNETVYNFVQWLLRIPRGTIQLRIGVYCFRGKHRSPAVAWLLSQILEAFGCSNVYTEYVENTYGNWYGLCTTCTRCYWSSSWKYELAHAVKQDA